MAGKRRTGATASRVAESATQDRIERGWLRLDLIVDVIRRAWQGKTPDPWKTVEAAIVAAIQAGEIPLYEDDECTTRATIPAERPLSHFVKLADVQRWFALNSRWPLGALNFPGLMNAKWEADPQTDEPRLMLGRRLWRLSEAVDEVVAMPGFGVAGDAFLRRALKAATTQELQLRDPENGAPRSGGDLSGFVVEWVFARDFNDWMELAGIPQCYKLPDDAPADDTTEPAAAAPASAVVKDGAPPPLTTGDTASCFDGLKWDEAGWKKNLGNKPKWLQGCVAIGGVRGVRVTRWNPVFIGGALVRAGHVNARKVRAKFQTQHLLKPWLEAWKTYEADNFDSD